MISRRAVLLGTATTLLAACSRVPDDVPDVDDGPVVSGSFASSYRRAEVGWSVAYPPGSSSTDRLPVLVALHGRGGDHNTAFGDSLHLDRFLADAVHHGVAPFAIAAADGGDHEYWHPPRHRIRGHDVHFWRRQAPAQLSSVGRHLPR